MRTAGLILVAIIVGILAYAAGQPDDFRVERRITVDAPPQVVYSLINDYRAWVVWSPWERKDPHMQRAYGGAASGVGAVYEWSGNADVGAGRMEISQSVPDSKVAVDLHFTAPFEAHNTVEFVLTPRGERTTVTWAMFGPSPYLAKLMGLFVSMDEMVGRDFESGLAALKVAAESRR